MTLFRLIARGGASCLFLVLLCGSVMTQNQIPRFERADCFFTRNDLPAGFKLECGYLTVLQDRAKPTRGQYFFRAFPLSYWELSFSGMSTASTTWITADAPSISLLRTRALLFIRGWCSLCKLTGLSSH